MTVFKVIRRIMILLSCLSLLTISVAYSEDAIRIKGNARLCREGSDNVYLNLSIVNEGSESILISKSNLPWGIRTSLLLIAVTAGPMQENIEESLFVDDPRTGDTAIKPGDEVSGRVYLNRRFPNIKHVLKKHDVIIFWSYQLVTEDGKVADRISGGLTIPKVKD